jgi:hypothetical protein
MVYYTTLSTSSIYPEIWAKNKKYKFVEKLEEFFRNTEYRGIVTGSRQLRFVEPWARITPELS